jgi:PAS domain S-box-containing protein
VTELSKFAFEVLRQDEHFILYRGRGANGSARVLLRSPTSQHPTLQNLKRLEWVYSLKEELDPAWAVRPIELANHWDRVVLVMEDPGGVPLEQLLGQPLNLAFSLRIAISLSSAIGHLHRRGFIHKDIKPAHVLVTPNTGQCWLMGFGISSRLPRERQFPEPPEFIDGTLPYMAPEQTGRMNRSVDSRSDLYSFGVLLYEMLTGSLPFAATDPMEWVHCHIARQPVPPSQRVEGVPPAISAIVMKLLSKTVEERYQTAAGVESDLRRCLDGLVGLRLAEALSVSMAPFPLGTHDIPDRLRIPEKLYGREHEIEALLAAFERVVKTGAPELVLVSGYPGIGKSSVVNELHKALVPPRGLLAAGKFDQYKRDIPYATLAQAIQNLIRLLLSKSETELDDWRGVLREALGPNGQLMVDLVPELKFIIGEQLQVPALPPQDAQRRFHLVFRRFIGVFARREHPLALFLDDLQWLDAATLDLLEDLLTQGDVKHLMLIGAYRDNEVTSAHPLMRKLEAVRQTEAIVEEIVLAPLTRGDLERLMTDALRCEPEHIASLAGLVHEKTSGNPFFAIQFISSLADQHLLAFDHAAGRWSWDLERIRAKGYTDNVVSLMVEKLRRLPAATQTALQQLACIGNSSQLALLKVVYQDSESDLHDKLRPAVVADLLLRLENSYTFLHDRVQEAAYSSIPEGLRAEAHLVIGRLLALHTPPEKQEEAIFEIVNQFNHASKLITSDKERRQVAELNFRAARRAKGSTAYTSALKYLKAGRALLTEENWESDYNLIFSIECLMAECELLTADTLQAETRLLMLAKRARSGHDVAVITRLRLTLYTTLDRSDRSVQVCLQYLRRIGTDWSPHPTREEVRQEYDKIWSLLGGRLTEEIIDLPLITNSDVLDTLDVLTEIVTPAFFTDQNLCALVLCRMVNLSLEHGNCDASCYAYVWLATYTGPYFGDYKRGFRFGQLGYDLVEKRGLTRYRARTYSSFGNIVVPWARHVREGTKPIRRALDIANASGDLTYAAYSWCDLMQNHLTVGVPLAEAQQDVENGLEFARKSRFGLIIDMLLAYLGLVGTLRGLTPKFGSFDKVEPDFNELRFEEHLSGDASLTLAQFDYWTRKLQARFFACDYAQALHAAVKAEPLFWIATSQFETAEYHFYGALTRAACWDSANGEQRRRHFEALTAHDRQLKIWAENCGENFENRAALVGAEIARIEGRTLDAEDLYEQAIRSAHSNGFAHNEALANELAGRFYLARRFEKTAYAYLRDARYNYFRWGASGKVRQLDELYPLLKADEPVIDPTGTISTPIEHLDFAAIIKVSQALSGEIVLENLINTLMRTVIEHAAAERGLLILSRDGDLRIEAEAHTSGNTIMVRLQQAPITEDVVPESIVRYVVRTGERVILDDASVRDPFAGDRYIHRRRARSVMCLPLVNQTKLVGLLYLENNLSPNVFTAVRNAALNLLASQAAISLENTRLYRDLQEREATLRRSETYLSEAQRLSQTGSFGWDVSKSKIYWSEETYRIFEYDRSTEPTLQLLLDRTHPEDRDMVQNIFDRVSDETKDFDYEQRLLMPDGSVKYLRVVGHPSTRDEWGRVEFIGAVTDITERKLAERALQQKEVSLRQTQAELAHVSRVTTMGELAASIAHEVNQPLVGVVTNASAGLRLLAGVSPNLLEAREAMRAIIRDGNRAADVVSRMRGLFKKARPAKEPVNINEAIEEVVLLTRSEVRRNRVALRMELATNLPLVMADRVQIQQVILNLILNGLQAMRAVEDRERVMVVRTQRDDGDQIRVAVQDCGVGIDPLSAERIFDAFHTTKPGGIGMGLTISRSIVESHGGRLWVTANDGPGATFQFTV